MLTHWQSNVGQASTSVSNHGTTGMIALGLRALLGFIGAKLLSSRIEIEIIWQRL